MFNTLDLIIILLIIFGGIIGFSRGFIKQGVMTVGLILVFILSYMLKNPISEYMYEHLPFFSIDLVVKNSTVINILIYELLAFAITFSILEVIFIILIKISSVIEGLIKVTQILIIPSKVLGTVLGIIEYYLLVFIILFILSFPTFNFNNKKMFTESQIRPIILKNTVIVSKITNSSLDTFSEIDNLIKDKDKIKVKEFDCKALSIMKKKNFISKKSYKYLYRTGKIRVTCD